MNREDINEAPIIDDDQPFTPEEEKFLDQKMKWRALFLLSALTSMLVFEFRDKAGKKVDVLSGKEAIRIFLRNNRIGLVLALIMFGVLIVALIPERGFHRSDSSAKVYGFLGSAGLMIYTVVAFILSGNHIYADYQGVTVAEPYEYVLSTQSGKYFVGFEDKDEFVQLQIPKKTYSQMQQGEKVSDDTGEIYSMVKDNGYKDAVLYSGGFEISYYFYSAIFSSAKPVSQR